MALGRSFEATNEQSLNETAAALLGARRDSRVGILHPVRVMSPSFDIPLSGQIRDISMGGLCIATPSPIPLENISGVEIHFPEGIVRLNVIGVWQTRMSIDQSVLTGLKFLQPDQRTLQVIRSRLDSSIREVGDFLSNVFRTSQIGIEDAISLAQSTRIRVVSRGQYLYRRGEVPASLDDAIFFIREGSVELSLPKRSGPANVTARLGPFSMLGGLGSIASVPHFEDAQTLEDTMVLEISTASFAYLRIAQPLLAQSLSQLVMMGQLQRVDRLVARMSGLDSDGKSSFVR